MKIIETTEWVSVFGGEPVLAKVDTGAFSSSVDALLVPDHLLQESELLRKEIKSALGREVRESIACSIELLDRNTIIHTTVTIADRMDMKYPVIIGRRDIIGYHVYVTEKVKNKKNKPK